MKRTAWIAAYVVIGAVAFWTPGILLHAWRNENPTIRTIMLPISLFVVYWFCRNLRRRETGNPSSAVFMILGVWLLGPTAMVIGGTFYGGGFDGGQDFVLVILMGILPFYTFSMAAYDGSLFGLLLASAVMFLAHLKFEPEHWVIPPTLRAWLTRGYRNHEAED